MATHTDINSLQENFKEFDRFEIRMDIKNQCYSHTYNIKQNFIRSKFRISCHSQVQHHSVLMVLFLSSGDKELFSLKVYKVSHCFKPYKNKLIILNAASICVSMSPRFPS